jgi:hypothetical protein
VIKKPSTTDYARLGAAMRRQQILAELKTIHKAFPDLRSNRRTAIVLTSVRSGQNGPGGKAQGGKPRRRWTLSAEQRKAISDRMKKTWAARRARK